MDDRLGELARAAGSAYVFGFDRVGRPLSSSGRSRLNYRFGREADPRPRSEFGRKQPDRFGANDPEKRTLRDRSNLA